MASVASVTSVHSNPPVQSTPLKRQDPTHITPASEGHKGAPIRISSPIALPRQLSYKDLADSPSPRSKLGDRVMRLKQKCINSLGEELFNQAYAYLKQHAAEIQKREQEKKSEEWEGDGSTDDIMITSAGELAKQQKIREILGGQKAHYLPLLDQLIFMEETHIQNSL